MTIFEYVIMMKNEIISQKAGDAKAPQKQSQQLLN